MKITSVDIYSSNSSNFVNFSFRDPTSQNPYVVKSIIGLDADEIVSKYYGSSDLINEKHYDLSLKKRDIVIQIGLNPNFNIGDSYSSLRDDLYKLISSSRTGSVRLQFNNEEEIVAVISGFITKFESSQFTKAPEVQLTINCSDPMLRAFTEVNMVVTDLDPDFTTIIDDKSTSPHGFRFGLIFTDTVVDFAIQDAIIRNWAFEVNLTGSSMAQFVAGDELHFSSETNNRYLYLIRGFDIIHLIDRIVPTSVWPIVFPGNNDFICSDFVDWDYITYYPTYWGV